MITLNELFNVTWDITKLDITARDPNGHLLHEWVLGENVVETIHMYHRRLAGELTITQEKINYHGEDNGRGVSEMGWGVKESMIPKELWTDYMYHDNLFIVIWNGEWIAVYNMDEVACIAVDVKRK